MKHQKYRIIYTFLLSIFLFIGQSATLVHAEEHPFHDAHESCEVFISAEHTDSTLVVSGYGLPVFKNDAPDIIFIISDLPVSLSVYWARAPPYLS